HVSSSPALGIKGAPQRSDTQRPTTAKPCGNVDIASNLDTSTAIAAAADRTVTMNVENCIGTDGSTSVSVEVDQTGTGKKFAPATVTTNGNPCHAPYSTRILTQLSSLPAGTKCTGGKAQNLCLVSVKTTHGFGGCTVVSQGKGSAGSSTTKTAAPAKSTK
ncbi:hypothetical protein B0H13DRAFT_1475681, partial [Mycena leptocephala]